MRPRAIPRRDPLVLNVIAQGEGVTITEASGNYATYPVEADGIAWVRVRAGDGLAGWVDSTKLEIR